MCEYSDLVRAILERDESRLRKALSNRDPKHQSTATGLSPIHFAVTWPIALTALIKIGVDVNVQDHFHRRPIHLATALGELEAVKILVDQDCAVWTHPHSLPLLQEALQVTRKETRRSITDLIITAHIDRYARFFSLALSVLPQSSPILAEIVPGIFNENLVPPIQQELKRHRCSIPPALELNSDSLSVYETADLHAWNRWPRHSGMPAFGRSTHTLIGE